MDRSDRPLRRGATRQPRRCVRRVAERWLDLPDDVDAYTLQSYLTKRFGEPTDVAVTDFERFGRLPMGWFFGSAALDDVGLPSEGLDMLADVYMTFLDGSRVPLFWYLADLKEGFMGAMGEMNVNVTEVSGTQEYEPPAESIRRSMATQGYCTNPSSRRVCSPSQRYATSGPPLPAL